MGRDKFESHTLPQDFLKLTEDSIYKSLVGLSAKVSRESFATSEKDIADILAAKAKALDLVKRHFNNMHATATYRRGNLEGAGRAAIVSLGYDCFPRTLMTRWGIKKTAKMGELSMPFDLSIHPSAAVAYILENDFKPYFDGSIVFDTAKDFPIHRELGIEFNHDTGKEFAKNNLQDFKTRYEKRVRNFKDMCADKNPVVFVHHVETPDIASVCRIFANLKERRGDKATSFVLLYTPPVNTKISSFAEMEKLGVHVIAREYPFENYVWHNQHHTFAIRGVAFERFLATELTLKLQELGALNVPESPQAGNAGTTPAKAAMAAAIVTPPVAAVQVAQATASRGGMLGPILSRLTKLGK